MSEIDIKKNKNKMLDDCEGNVSSKRVTGITLVSAGLLFLLVVGIYSIFKEVADAKTAIEVGKTIIIVGAGLLGIGVVEFLGGKK